MVEINDRRNKDTLYSPETPVGLRRVLDSQLGAPQRVRVHYEKSERPSEGYLVKHPDGYPLIQHNQRSDRRASPIPDEYITRIELARKNRDRSRTVLWQK